VKRHLPVAFLMIALLCPCASGEPIEGQKDDLHWALSAEARFRPEWRDNADLDSRADDDTREGFMRTRLGLRLGYRELASLFVQVQDSRVAGEEASTASNEDNLDLHQGYVTLRPAEDGIFSLTVGRQEWSYGDQRLIGAFGWNNVGRSFDGVRGRFERPSFVIDGLAARISSRTSGGATEGSDLYGVYAQIKRREADRIEGYLLSFDDSVRAPGEAGQPGQTQVNALGGRIKQVFGRLDYTAEAVWESGEFRGDDLQAWAAGLQGGFTWGDTTRLRAFGGYDFATGDEDPTDGDREEFFNFFPTNHGLYGYMDYEGWRNIRSPFAGGSLKQGRHFAQAKVHRFLLEEERGAWKSAGGAVLGLDPTGASGTNVGSEVDLTYRFAWNPRSTVEAGLSRFEPGRFARRTRGRSASTWGYVMLTVRL